MNKKVSGYRVSSGCCQSFLKIEKQSVPNESTTTTTIEFVEQNIIPYYYWPNQFRYTNNHKDILNILQFYC